MSRVTLSGTEIISTSQALKSGYEWLIEAKTFRISRGFDEAKL
jgi:hypothetical protein